MIVALFLHLKRTPASERLEHSDRNVATFALGVHAWIVWLALAAPPTPILLLKLFLHMLLDV